MAFYWYSFTNIYKPICLLIFADVYLLFVCPNLAVVSLPPNQYCSIIMQLICADGQLNTIVKAFIIFRILDSIDIYLPKVTNNVIIIFICYLFLCYCHIVSILWVGQYSKNVNFKLLIIKLLYGCYGDMFTINGFIHLSFLLVYSLKMVTGNCNRNESIFL